MKPLGGRVFRALLVAALAVFGLVAVAAAPAGAITTACDTGTAPALPGAQSNLKLQCADSSTNSGTRQVIHDYPFAQYHFGSSRPTNVTFSATTGVFTLVGAATASNTFVTTATGDLNRTITASSTTANGVAVPAASADQTCLKIPAKASLKAIGSATAATVSNKTGMLATALSGTKTSTTLAGSAMMIATGTAVFSACDVGRTITGTGVPAGEKVAQFINTKLIIMTTGTGVTGSTGFAHTFGAKSVTIKVDNTPARSLEGAALTKGSSAIVGLATGAGPSGFNITTDVGMAITGTCIPDFATITGVTDATHASMAPALATCTNTARTVTGDITGTAPTQTVTLTTGTFDNEDQFRVTTVTGGTCTASAGTLRVDPITSSTVATISGPGTVGNGTGCTITLTAFAALQKLTINGTMGSLATASTARFIHGTTCASNLIVNPAGVPDWKASDVNMVAKRGATSYRITGVSGATATVTPVCATSAVSTDTTVGTVTDTAPATGDFVVQLASNLALRDDLVDGTPPCSDAQFTGTSIAGSWASVGSYAATTQPFGGSLVDYPKDTVAQFKFPTSVVTFYGYVAERPASNTDEVSDVDPQVAAHSDVVLPNLPTGLAVCPGTDTGLGFTVIGQALGSQQGVTGLGIPSSAIVRGTRGLLVGDGGSYTDTAYVTIHNPVGPVHIDVTGDACTVDTATDLSQPDRGFNCLAP